MSTWRTSAESWNRIPRSPCMSSLRLVWAIGCVRTRTVGLYKQKYNSRHCLQQYEYRPSVQCLPDAVQGIHPAQNRLCKRIQNKMTAGEITHPGCSTGPLHEQTGTFPLPEILHSGIARTKLIVQKRSQGAEFHTKGNTSCPDHSEA